MRGELVQLFTNWPTNRTPGDKVVDINMGTALRHIADVVVAPGLGVESPWNGKQRPGSHSPRHSAVRHWVMVRRVPLNVVRQWIGHASVQVALRIYLPIVGSDYGTENVP